MIQTALVSIVSIVFSSQKEKYLGVITIFQDIGLCLGPVIGIFLYHKLGYELAFITVGVTFFIIAPIIYFILPDAVNISAKNSDTNPQDSFNETTGILSNSQSSLKVSDLMMTPGF